MSSVNRFATLALGFALTSILGCHVGPGGYGQCGDYGQCGGCGQCDGCGELYIDPWINHPPDCCDPCDSCGNYTGQSCGKCRSVFAGVKTIWGYRCDDGCDGGCGHQEISCGCEAGPDCTGCDSCFEQDATCGMETYAVESGPVYSGPIVLEEPTPARQVAPTRSAMRPYPQGILRIFQNRSDTPGSRSGRNAF